MNDLHRHEMTSPEGTLHMVLERDRVEFEKRGYVVTGSIDPLPAQQEPATPSAGSPSPVPAAEERKPLSSMNRTELVALAGTLGLDTDGTKAVLVERIKQAEAAAAPQQE